MSEEQAREWLIAGGGGFEGGEDGIRAVRVSGQGLIEYLATYGADCERRGMEKAAQELDALRQFKKSVDTTFTASMLAISGEVGFKIPCHQFVTEIKVGFRRAEEEYMKSFGAAAIHKEMK